MSDGGKSLTDLEDSQQEKQPVQRLQSLDVYRGLIMISLAFVGFGLAATAGNFLETRPESAFWKQVQYQFSHAEWVGCSYWDLIQPSFMFMVGVSMAYSYAKRQALGHSYMQMLRHAVTRAFVLVALSVFLMSMWSDATNWTFMNVLAQIGIAYPFLFLLWNRPFRIQAIAATLLLVGTWIAYEAYPNSGVNLQSGAPEVGVTREWAQEHLTGIRDPWHKNANVGHAIDIQFLNQFPREEPFRYSGGGYPTINVVPSLATMLFGLMCGELLRSRRSSKTKLLILFGAGAVGLASGYALDLSGVIPIVKRIWSPSWTLFSTGWCCLILGSLYGIFDVLKLRFWTFPVIVIGMNPIAIYCMSMTLKPWVRRQLEIHFGENVFTFYGAMDPVWTPTVQATLVGLVFWLVCYYMYRNRIFIRV